MKTLKHLSFNLTDTKSLYVDEVTYTIDALGEITLHELIAEVVDDDDTVFDYKPDSVLLDYLKTHSRINSPYKTYVV